MVSGWEIVEEASYARSVAEIHEILAHLDEAVAPLDYALHRNPEGFPQVPGIDGILLAKTSIRFVGTRVIPSLKLWFRIDRGARRVHKLWLAVSRPEEMEYWNADGDGIV